MSLPVLQLAEQCSVHGWKYVSDMATAAALGTAAPQKPCRVGGLFKTLCPPLSSDTFPLPLSTAQRPHLSIRDVQAPRQFCQTTRTPSSVWPPLHILLSSLLPLHPSLSVFMGFFHLLSIPFSAGQTSPNILSWVDWASEPLNSNCLMTLLLPYWKIDL